MKKRLETGLITVKFKGKCLVEKSREALPPKTFPAVKIIAARFAVPFNLDYFLFTGNTVISRARVGWINWRWK